MPAVRAMALLATSRNRTVGVRLGRGEKLADVLGSTEGNDDE